MFDVDLGLLLLGRWSRWQLFHVISISTIIMFFASWHIMSIVFLAQMPDFYHCTVPDGIDATLAIPPSKVDPSMLASCEHYVNFTASSNETEYGCPLGMTYSEGVYSIVQQFDTVCDRAVIASTAQTMFVVGMIAGAIAMAFLADRFGRKKITLISVLIVSGLALINAWVTNLPAFMFFRFLIGFCQQGVIVVGFVYVLEFFPSSDRTIAGILMQCLWPVGLTIMSGMAYFTEHWQYFLTATAVPGVLVIPFLWISPESIPFLVARGHVLEAKKLLGKAAKFNKVELPKEYLLTEREKKLLKQGIKIQRSRTASQFSLGDPDGEVYHYGVMDILGSRKMVAFVFINAYLWCVAAWIYHGIALSIGSMGGDIYVSFIIQGLVEIPAYVAVAFVLNRYGRRWPIFSFFLIGGVALFINAFIPKETPDGTSLHWVIFTFAMIGKFGLSGAFAGIYLYSPEMFPTTIRGIGLSFASVGGTIGNIAAPYMMLLASVAPWLLNVLFGIMSLLAAIMVLYLPETLGRPLPTTIEEVEAWTRTLSQHEKDIFEEKKLAEKARIKLLLEETEQMGAL